MELLEGQDLRSGAPFAPREACSLFYDVVSCLALLHARGFVHRDVSARNIRIVAPGRAKLIDFGALAPFGPCELRVGTPLYVAPEVLLVQPLDGRLDLYSVGVALYFALSGQFPYRARSFTDLRAAWSRPPVPVDTLVPEVPAELARLTMRLIALDRMVRPRDAAAVMEQLAALGGLERREPVGARRA